MIGVCQNKDVVVKDVGVTSFIFKYKNGNASHSISLDPTDFLEGGRLSTGSIFMDMALFTLDIVNKIASSVGIRQLAYHDLKGMNTENELNSQKPLLIQFDGVVTDDKFEVLPGVPVDYFWLEMFSPKLTKFRKCTPSGNKVISCEMLENVNLNISQLIDLMYKVFLYTYSQTVRDRLTAYAVRTFTKNYYTKGLAFSNSASNTLVFDSFFNDYIELSSSLFVPKQVYPLSTQNNTVSSVGQEALSFLDVSQLFNGSFNYMKRNQLEVSNDSCLLTTAKLGGGDSTNQNNTRIFSLSGYRASSAESFLCGVTLYAHYDLPSDFSESICAMFREPNKKTSQMMARVTQCDEAMKMKYNEIVFDKSINDVIDNSMVKLSMSYTGYTPSGGARFYGYETLLTKKITPTSRRDLINEVILSICANSGIDRVKLYTRLNVDFKRFYGFVKK